MLQFTGPAVALLAILATAQAIAGPEPGSVFREYMWFNETGDAGQALRVGWRGMEPGEATEPVGLDHEFDLEGATHAEIVIEKILCHDGTRGLEIEVNGHGWIPVPEAERIAAPQWAYQHHTYPTVSVPLEQLKPGSGNEFRMRVSAEHPWDWPQNLINGLHFRIYYGPGRKPHPTGRLVGVEPGAAIGRSVELSCEATSPNGAIERVDYVGEYEDVNWTGDGEYRCWQYTYTHGRLAHHIGSAEAPPYRVTWDTQWLPDQAEPVRLAARITDETGTTTMTPAVEGVRLVRAGLSVELCKPYDVPEKWVTRSGEHEERFGVAGDLDKAISMRLAWSSWSPGYMNGISINGERVFGREGPHYAAFAHTVTLDAVDVLRPGENRLNTGLTPKRNGQMVHGMEVNWPGIMVLVRYETTEGEAE